MIQRESIPQPPQNWNFFEFDLYALPTVAEIKEGRVLFLEKCQQYGRNGIGKGVQHRVGKYVTWCDGLVYINVCT